MELASPTEVPPLGSARCPAYHAAMRSVSQLAYLQALDIPTLVSRQNLPGAAPTRRLQLARSAAPAGAEPVAESEVAPAGLASISADLKAGVSGQPAAPAAAPSVRAPRERGETPIFSLAATLAGGWFWLDEIPSGREPGDDYGQLLLAICRALNWSQEPARLERFSYPVAAGLAGGIDEAREALLGFLTGRLSRLSPQGVILMGDLEQPWFDRQCLDGQRLVQTVSAWQMLRDPQLKVRAWADLKTLRGDG